MQDPHLVKADSVLQELQTEVFVGLSKAEAEQRLVTHGPNELVEKGGKNAFAILFAQVKEVMIVILLIAAGISAALHEYIDAVVIFIIVILNTLLGFWQEFKAENAMAALKKLAVPNVRVWRDGAEQEISAKALVPGDILLVEAGDIVPADARLVNVANLKVQESALTGESEPVEKNAKHLQGGEVPLGDRTNMIFMGTVVTYGRAQAVVTGTGMKTELGNIATMLQEVEDEQTPLQRRLAKLGASLAGAAVLLIIVVATMTYLRGVELKETVMTAISMAVAAIPEGLPAVVTIALALGAQQMLKKKSLIRQLPAVETLGSVTVICSDKTGTLTQNKMTVTDIVLPDRKYTIDDAVTAHGNDPNVGLLLLSGVLCNDAVLDENAEHGFLGDPTEGALVMAAQKIELSKASIESFMPRVRELPFDSERKRMTTVHAFPASSEGHLRRLIELAGQAGHTGHIAFTKGAVDGLMEPCTHVISEGKLTSLTDELKQKILAENTTMAKNGIRVLGSAFRFIEETELQSPETYEQQLVYLGMTGMLDPVRPEAVEAVRLCKQAGIRVIMITGDHPLTALAIAKDLGITENDKFLTGRDLAKIGVEDLKIQLKDVSVFARVSPEHKMVIIDALQEEQQIVSMTGDGVNDAPALKSADIGVAMGITGTDVSKESSDMVLLDDNFATIVTAVREGRRIYDNIRKFVKYILTGNAGEIVVMLTGPILGMPLPLLPIQILWINLVTDGVPAIALGYEEAEHNVMERPPYKPQEGIFARGLGWQILIMGVLVGLLSIGVGYWFWDLHPESTSWQTMVFTMLTFCQMAYALCVRKQHQSILTHSWFTNKVMLLAVGLTLGLQLILVYTPFFNAVFRTTPLTVGELGVCFGGAAVVIVFTEIEKLILKGRTTLFNREDTRRYAKN